MELPVAPFDVNEGDLRMMLVNTLHSVAGAVANGADIEVVAAHTERVRKLTEAIGPLQEKRKEHMRAQQAQQAQTEKIAAEQGGMVPS